MTSERKRFEILLEDIQSKLQLLAEGIGDLRRNMDEVKIDMGIMKEQLHYIAPIKIVVQEHEERLLVLEKKAA